MSTIAEANISLPTQFSTQPAFVKVEHVEKRFKKTLVLEDINLTASSGQFVSLIGPSGCGKSTLLRLLAGLEGLTSGSLIIDGMKPVNARNITSFVFQDATLLPWRTVEKNVSLALELDHVASSQRKEMIKKSLELVSLSHVAKHYPRQLSGGMKMRVSIARALVTRPRLLLMDEPFGALDEITRNRLNEELLRLHRAEGWTTFFVTHSVSEAVFLSDRIVILKANPGQIVDDVEVDLPKVRSEELRSSSSYLTQVASISEKLRSFSMK